jgi:hypothetical protein
MCRTQVLVKTITSTLRKTHTNTYGTLIFIEQPMVDNLELFKKVLIKNTSLVTGTIAGVYPGVI